MGVDGLVSHIAAKVGDSGKAVVALSGGVDSGLAAWAAHKAVGNRPRAATVVSELTPPREARRAESVAAHIGMALRRLPVRALGNPLIRANAPDRCYHCKSLIFSELRHAYGPDVLLIDGTNADDDPLRPGLKALREHSVFSPLREVGLDKAAVRTMARAVGLPNWDTPSESCLATRIAHGVPLDAEALKVVAEDRKSVV